jgi:hypothetical protein
MPLINRRRFAAGASCLAPCLAGNMGLMALPAAAQAQLASGAVMQVGHSRAVRTLAQAARLARAGQRIEVDAGDYPADVAVWTHDDLTLRAVGGRVRLLAQGASAEGKAIWVVRAKRMRVQGFDFEGCAVPGRNGAGIRFESGSLSLRDCSFTLNEMGLLTSNDENAMLDVENCEFAHNMRPDGHNHNLYVGAIARVSVMGSYFHHARTGHLLKSRAAVSRVFYNRLTDEAGGSASYELEFPNGGLALVVGNLMEQGPQTENPYLISVGAEGYRWPNSKILLVNNTLVNRLAQGGEFLRVMPGAQEIRALNNLLVGHGALESAGAGSYRHNFQADAADFANLPAYDARLKRRSALVGRGVGAGSGAGTGDGQSLSPSREYTHPRSTRAVSFATHNPGAMQSLA